MNNKKAIENLAAWAKGEKSGFFFSGCTLENEIKENKEFVTALNKWCKDTNTRISFCVDIVIIERTFFFKSFTIRSGWDLKRTFEKVQKCLQNA